MIVSSAIGAGCCSQRHSAVPQISRRPNFRTLARQPNSSFLAAPRFRVFGCVPARVSLSGRDVRRHIFVRIPSKSVRAISDVKMWRLILSLTIVAKKCDSQSLGRVLMAGDARRTPGNRNGPRIGSPASRSWRTLDTRTGAARVQGFNWTMSVPTWSSQFGFCDGSRGAKHYALMPGLRVTSIKTLDREVLELTNDILRKENPSERHNNGQ